MKHFICSIAIAAALSATFLPTPAMAQGTTAERPVLSLSGANFRPMPLAITAPVTDAKASAQAAGKAVDDALNNDLKLSGIFNVLDRRSFLAPADEGTQIKDIKFNQWSDVGAESLLKVRVVGSDPVVVEFRFYNVGLAKEELNRRYTVPASQARRAAHAFADELFTYYTREPGSFQTRLTFVRKVKGFKQVFVGDFDAHNALQLTNKSMNLLPSWVSEREVAFTGYESGAPALYRIDVSGRGKTLFFKKFSRLVTGATFSQDGKHIAFAMSHDDGNSHIWLANADGTNPKQLTQGFGINSSPSFSPDGKRIAYVSNRSGNPHIHVIDITGGTPKRLTFQGNYNQTPEWSPRGDRIVFTARDEKLAFDLFTIDVESGVITRLTQDGTNNEEPTWSPNGRLIAFTSTRTGTSQLYIINAEGGEATQVTFGKDPVYTPSWGPFTEDVLKSGK